MKLSKLYSNQPSTFTPIKFNDGFNVVLGKIIHPEDYKKDTHNLGKTTLAKLLDFVFLAQRKPQQFLFKNYNIFENFIFFLELKLGKNNYLTIRRSVAQNTKISFKLHTTGLQDFSNLSNNEWYHSDIPFEQAKTLLDGWLNFNALKHWKYRNILGYLIRTQNDFNNVFKLQKQQGKDIDWKPYMADLLGFNGKLAILNYQKKEQIQKLDNKIKPFTHIHKNLNEELSTIDGKILIRNSELEKIEKFTSEFNFNSVDQETINQLVSSIDTQISQLNMHEYAIKNNIDRIEKSLNVENIKFDTTKVKKLFEEAAIVFPDQITKDFDQLIKFNKTITEERNEYLKSELQSLNIELKKTQEELVRLNSLRAEQIVFLGETELVVKFKKANNQLAQIKADIEFLYKQKEEINQILELEKEIHTYEKELDKIQTDIQLNVHEVNQDKNSIFSSIRLYFNEIINEILDKEGSIKVYLNKEGNFEFDATYHDKKGVSTNEGDGHTYKKLLCFAFDLAVSRTYLDKNYPTFLYIDGIFDNLDIRKKRNTLDLIRKYSELGLQIIITTIESEVADLNTIDQSVFTSNEVILTLHDDGETGRLFKIPIW